MAEPAEGVYLGIDIGGTNTKVAVLDADADRVVATGSVLTDRSGAAATLARAASLAVEWIAEHPGIRLVGITIPGHFDSNGSATIVPNIPGPWLGQPVRDVIASASGRPTVLINDARAHGLAESRLGAGRGAPVVAALVLGTGVGGALVIDGRLHRGTTGLAGEIGHTVVLADGPPCGCGNHGCLESLARSDAIASAAGAATVAEAVERATAGDVRALEAIATAGRWMGLALANVANVYAPDVIVVGGGVSLAGGLLFDSIRAEFVARTPLLAPEATVIVSAQLGTTAGAVGAALAAAAADDVAL